MSIQENDLKGDRSTESIWRVKEPNEAKYNFSDEEGKRSLLAVMTSPSLNKGCKTISNHEIRCH